MFTQFLENDNIVRQLSQLFYKISDIPPIVLVGETGLGKKTLARMLSAGFLCEEQQPTPCGKCNICKKVFKNIHPDVINVFDNSKNSTSVELVREVIFSASTPPNEGKRKVYIFDQAEKITSQAQNALLKLLEEPPNYCIFIFLVNNISGLIPTILSRVNCYKLSRLSSNSILDLLKKQSVNVEPEKLQQIANRSNGNPGAALELLKTDLPDYVVFCEKLITAYMAKKQYDFLKLLFSLEKDKIEMAKIYFQLTRYLRDILSIRSNAEIPLNFPDRYDVLLEFANKLTSKSLIQMIDAFNDAKELLDNYASPTLANSVLFLNCWEKTS